MVVAPDLLPLAVAVGAAPPNPEYTVPPAPVDTADAPPLAVFVAVAVDIVLVLTLVGLCAPQG